MNAKFTEISAAADYIGPGAVEVPLYQQEIRDLVQRRGLFGRRIKQVPATGHPSRFWEEKAGCAPVPYDGKFYDPRLDEALKTLSVEQRIAVKGELHRLGLLTPEPHATFDRPQAPTPKPERVERYIPLKALVAQITYNLFDMELGKQQSQFAYLQAKDLTDTVENVLRTHDVALWNGTDTSLSSPTTAQYYGVAAQIAAGGNTATVGTNESIVHALKSAVAEMVANTSFGVRPTAIYANPVLLDLIDREMKSEFNVALDTMVLDGGFTVKVLSTQVGDLPLIPEWTLPYTDKPGSGSAVLPAYIVTEDMIEYHWLGDANPRVFQLGVPGSLASQYVVVKFGAPVVKGANYAHYQVLVER